MSWSRQAVCRCRPRPCWCWCRCVLKINIISERQHDAAGNPAPHRVRHSRSPSRCSRLVSSRGGGSTYADRYSWDRTSDSPRGLIAGGTTGGSSLVPGSGRGFVQRCNAREHRTQGTNSATHTGHAENSLAKSPCRYRRFCGAGGLRRAVGLGLRRCEARAALRRADDIPRGAHGCGGVVIGVIVLVPGRHGRAAPGCCTASSPVSSCMAVISAAYSWRWIAAAGGLVGAGRQPAAGADLDAGEPAAGRAGDAAAMGRSGARDRGRLSGGARPHRGRGAVRWPGSARRSR